MQLSDLLMSALENLSRRKVRTILTSTGVIVGILTIVTMVSLGVGVQEAIRTQFAALGLENVFVEPGEGQDEADFFTQFGLPQRERPLTPEILASWAARPEVGAVVPQVSLAGVTSLLELPDGQLVGVQVANSERLPNPFRTAPRAVAGTVEPLEQPGSIVIAAGALPGTVDPAALIGRELNIVLRSPRGESQRFPLRVAGVSDLEERTVYAASDDMVAMKAWWFNLSDYLTTQGYDLVVVQAKDVAAAAQLVREFRATGYRVQSLELLLEQANRIFAVINVMLASVGGLALFVASLGIVNTMIMAIYERTREIGTLKAIGASRSDIRGLFMLEAGMIGLLGGLVGSIGGWLVGILLNQFIGWYIAREALPISGTFFITPWWLILSALIFAALVGIVAGLYPAGRAARLDPLVALRYE